MGGASGIVEEGKEGIGEGGRKEGKRGSAEAEGKMRISTGRREIGEWERVRRDGGGKRAVRRSKGERIERIGKEAKRRI